MAEDAVGTSAIIQAVDHGIIRGLLESAAERPVPLQVGHADAGAR
jgi:hypothetical protein